MYQPCRVCHTPLDGVQYGQRLRPQRSALSLSLGITFDHVTTLRRPNPSSSASHWCLTGLTLKSPPVSPQSLLPKTSGSPTLVASSCQVNSVLRDASSVGPSLGTTMAHIAGHVYHCLLGHSFSFLYVSLPIFCLRIPAPPLLPSFST